MSPARPRSIAALTVLLAGCGGAPPVVPTPDVLAYGRPDPNPAAYTFADTTVFSIRTDMGPMEVVTARAGTAELDFRRWAGDSRVFVRFPELQGSFTNPMQGATRVDESDIGGAFAVRVDSTGLVAVVDTPSLSAAMRDIAGPAGLVQPLFVQLPGRPVEAGARWVDTVTTIEESASARSEVQSVVTSVLQGDTVVAGRRFLHIRTTSVDNVQIAGVSGGVNFEQRLTGTGSGFVLWDPAAQLLVERVETGELSGVLELPDTGAASMAMTARLARSVSLRQ